MSLTVKETFQEYSDLSPSDTGLAKRIIAFEQYALNKTPDHTEFFGGNLIGYPIARFSPADKKKWLEEVCLIDDVRNCQLDLYECPNIERDYAVSSEIFNLSIPWIMHILWNQKKTTKNRPEMVSCLTVGMMFHLTSFMHGRFQYGAKPAIALAMFENLDFKNDFKKEGSWIGLIRARTDIFMDTDGRYPDVWQDMVNDLRTVRMCNEINGNIRSTVNILKDKYETEAENQNRIESVSKVGEVDGEKMLKDYIRRADRLKEDMGRICADPNNLIKDEIIEIMPELLKTYDDRLVREILYYFSDNFRSKKDDWEETVNRLMIYILALPRTKGVSFKNIGEVVNVVVSMLRSSSTSNKDIIFIKRNMIRLSKKVHPSLREAKHPSNAISIVVYLTIRALSINYFK